MNYPSLLMSLRAITYDRSITLSQTALADLKIWLQYVGSHDCPLAALLTLIIFRQPLSPLPRASAQFPFAFGGRNMFNCADKPQTPVSQQPPVPVQPDSNRSRRLRRPARASLATPTRRCWRRSARRTHHGRQQEPQPRKHALAGASNAERLSPLTSA